MNFEIPENIKREFRKLELAKYDRAYFLNEHWKEDIPGVAGNRGLSYNDPNHVERFRIIASAFNELFEFASVLDAGCGLGDLLTAWEAFPTARLVGVDASPDAITLGSNRLDRNSKIELIQSNLIDLAFGNAEFDLVVCLDVLEHVPIFDIGEALKQIFRVSNGSVILSINSDNPYKYHPTILSPETWRALLGSIDGWRQNHEFEIELMDTVCKSRVEYDFYCYSKN